MIGALGDGGEAEIHREFPVIRMDPAGPEIKINPGLARVTADLLNYGTDIGEFPAGDIELPGDRRGAGDQLC
jgi:hypothetical protein